MSINLSNLTSLILASVLLLSCSPNQGGQNSDVKFKLTKPTIEVDTTSYGWETTTTQEVVAVGPDSSKSFLVLAWANQGVSMEAGEKPERKKIAVLVTDGSGMMERTTLAQRCDEYTSSDCINEWIDPDHSFKVIGYVPLADISNADTMSAQSKPASKSSADFVDLGNGYVDKNNVRMASLFYNGGSSTDDESGEDEDYSTDDTNVDSILAAEMGVTTIGDFTYRETTDEITGQTKRVLATSSESSYTDSATLFWRCSDEGAEIYISTDEYLDSDSSIPTRYRFDNDKAQGPDYWSPSTDGDAAFAPDRSIQSFTAGAKGAREVAIRVEDYDDSEYTYTFSLMGLTRGLQRMPCFE